jgi:predicted ATPase/transcriptional regulator with XRE-family HTH domain
MEVDASFGYWLRRRRKALDLTQEALAAQISCSVTTIRKLEADERRPSRQMAELLAQALAIEPKERPLFLKVARGELRVERLPATDPVLAPPPLALTPPATLVTALDHAPALPLSTTPLVGRSVELNELLHLLGTPTCRLVTVTGAGGMGKTRLAQVVAHSLKGVGTQKAEASGPHFRDGVFFVSLAPLFAPEFMVQAIAGALGFTFYGSTDPKRQLLSYLRNKAVLLVLDNLEHLLASSESAQAAMLVTELLQQAPFLKLLVTSRERLHVQSEWVFELQGLPLPPEDTALTADEPLISAEAQRSAGLHAAFERDSAVALFVQRAQQAQHDFVLSVQNRADVVRICRLVNGMPLGIELAAAWVHLLSCQEIADEIARNLDFLTVTRHDVPLRHHSLRAAFDHSWRLLSVEEQRVLRQVAVFPSGFTRAAAEQVAKATLPLLSALTHKSLLRRTATNRYELHELVRQYAYEWLRTAEEETSTRTRHLAYYQQVAEQVHLRLLTAEQPHWRHELETEYGNLRCALTWALCQASQPALLIRGLSLAGALWLFWWLGAQWLEGATWLHQLLAVAMASDEPAEQVAYQRARARALYGAATLALDQYKLQQALLLSEESLRLCRTAGDRRGVAYTLYQLGVLALAGVGHTHQVAAYLQESRTLFRQLNEPRGLALPVEALGRLAWRRGDHRTATALWEEALRLNREAGDPMGIAQSADHLAKIWLRQGDYPRAQTLLAESRAVYEALGNRFGKAYMLLALGRIAHAHQDYQQAKQRYTESQAILQGLGSQDGRALLQLGCLALAEGNLAEARTWLEHSLALAQEVGLAEHIAQAQCTLALLLLAQAEYPAAQALLVESLSCAQALQDPDLMAQALCGAAQLALVQEDVQRAGRLLGAAQGLWDGLGLSVLPELRVGYEQCLHRVRSQLDEASFHLTWVEGHVMNGEQALTYALRSLDPL